MKQRWPGVPENNNWSWVWNMSVWAVTCMHTSTDKHHSVCYYIKCQCCQGGKKAIGYLWPKVGLQNNPAVKRVQIKPDKLHLNTACLWDAAVTSSEHEHFYLLKQLLQSKWRPSTPTLHHGCSETKATLFLWSSLFFKWKETHLTTCCLIQRECFRPDNQSCCMY